MDRLEIIANEYPKLSIMEVRGIEIIHKNHVWKVFKFPENWRTKHADKGVENIVTPTGEIFGTYRVSYLTNMEVRKIQIF